MASTTSGPTGTFTLGDLLPSTTSVRVTAAGWAPRTIGGVSVTGGQTTALGTIQLDAGGTVTGCGAQKLYPRWEWGSEQRFRRRDRVVGGQRGGL